MRSGFDFDAALKATPWVWESEAKFPKSLTCPSLNWLILPTAGAISQRLVEGLCYTLAGVSRAKCDLEAGKVSQAVTRRACHLSSIR